MNYNTIFQGIIVFLFFTLTIGCKEINKDEIVINKSHKRPNIVFLLADDMGYGELGSYGQKVIKTPFLDSLSREGMKFEQFYANSVCSPSRAVLMTGKHPGHISIRGNSGIGDNNLWYRVPLKREEKTIGEQLKGLGYKTGIIGKWHLENPDSIYSWAHNRGFDYTFHRQWNNFSDKPNDPTYIWESGIPLKMEDVWVKNYVSRDELRTDKAIEFINKNKTNPFFLLMSYKIPHTPESDINDDEIYADRGWPEVERQHAGRITILDGQIKRLFHYLKKNDLLDNTIVLFTSDNGPHNEGGHDHDFFNSNGPLKGYKRDLYEGGIRVPFIAYWKGKIAPNISSNHVATLWDVFPTICDLTESSVPSNVDGISFLNELLGEEQSQHNYLYWEFQLDGWWQELPAGGFRQAIRKENWKAIRYGVNNKIELYNLESDPEESRDIAAQYPEVIKEIQKLFMESSTKTIGFPYGGKKQNYKAKDKWQLNKIN
ncbi:arylsulfatase [Seonamhaeicola sp. MEBiC1930]|uniref:arylsulfatase n=1 Tax=Seonamhaeicola sp. MEBiC01930 TaxID=2976768 RepID=UPI003255A86C